jgi:hypothetical protein
MVGKPKSLLPTASPSSTAAGRFLAQARQAQLSDGAAALKREIAKKQAETEAKAA